LLQLEVVLLLGQLTGIEKKNLVPCLVILTLLCLPKQIIFPIVSYKFRNYMKKGLSVWLDVPLDALAKRIARVGTASPPLLDQPCDDRYTAVATLILQDVLLEYP